MEVCFTGTSLDRLFLIKNNKNILDQQKKKDLETTVLKGLCPHCGSVEVKYYELERNQKFSFNCHRCGYEATYTANEFAGLSAHW